MARRMLQSLPPLVGQTKTVGASLQPSGPHAQTAQWTVPFYSAQLSRPLL